MITRRNPIHGMKKSRLGSWIEYESFEKFLKKCGYNKIRIINVEVVKEFLVVRHFISMAEEEVSSFQLWEPIHGMGQTLAKGSYIALENGLNTLRSIANACNSSMISTVEEFEWIDHELFNAIGA